MRSLSSMLAIAGTVIVFLAVTATTEATPLPDSAVCDAWQKFTCTDDPCFRWKDQAKKTCDWVGKFRRRRRKLCRKRKVRKRCRETCQRPECLPPSASPSSSPTEAADTGPEEDCSVSLSEDGMSAVDVRRAYVASEMSNMIESLRLTPNRDQDSDYDDIFGIGGRGNYYETDINAVYTAKIQNDYCLVAYRGTVRDSLDDWYNNAAVGPTTFKMDSNSDDNCEVHTGWHISYVEQQVEVESFLETCIQECPECEVVLTGHSQGGGIAEVASLFYRKKGFPTDKLYVPIFAAPQALGAGCNPLFSKEERCRHFRYILSINSQLLWGRVFDIVPLLAYRGLVLLDDNFDFLPGVELSDQNYARKGGLAMLGHEIFLNGEDSSTVSVAGFDDHYVINLNSFDNTGFTAHYSSTYRDILKEQSETDFSTGDANKVCNLPTDGFPLNSLCNTAEDDLTCIAGSASCQRTCFLCPQFACASFSGAVTPDPNRFCESV